MSLLFSPRFWLAIAIAAVLGFAGHFIYRAGKAAVRTEFDAYKLAEKDAVIKEGHANAKETQRRLDRQKENDDAQAIQLAAARSDAALNDIAAQQLRQQNATVAHRWREALGDTPTVVQCAAAGAAITVQADVLGRADGAAGELASYADAARIAGLQCQADYEALTP